MNNLPKVVTQQRRGRASNPRLLDRKSDALPLSHRVIVYEMTYNVSTGMLNPSIPYHSITFWGDVRPWDKELLIRFGVISNDDFMYSGDYLTML